MYHSQAGYTRQRDSQYGTYAFPMASISQTPVPAQYTQLEAPQRVMTGAKNPFPSSLSERAPGVTQTQMEQMMASTTGSYQGLIQDFSHFRQVHDQYLKIHNRPRGDCSDFPSNPQEQQQLVKLLFEAAHDCSQTYEPEGSQSVRRIQSGSYTDIEFELVLWPVLFSTRDAQIGQCRLPNYLYCKEPPYNSYGSFTERFEAVCDALKSSKDVVVSLFKDATFKHRLAWRPRTELNQKATNRKLNGERDVQNAIGIRVAQENGIKTNPSGELIDKNGQSYGTVKKRSSAFEDKIMKTRKRGRDPKRNKSPDKSNTGEHEDAAEANSGNGEANVLQSANYMGYADVSSQVRQEVSSGYAPNSINEHLPLPPLPSMTNAYSRQPNQFVGSDASYTFPLNNGNALPTFASGKWASNSVPTTGYVDPSIDFNLDFNLLQAETAQDQLNQDQDLTGLYSYDLTAPAAFSNHLENTTAQGQPDLPNTTFQPAQQAGGQYFTQDPLGYYMQS